MSEPVAEVFPQPNDSSLSVFILLQCLLGFISKASTNQMISTFSNLTLPYMVASIGHSICAEAMEQRAKLISGGIIFDPWPFSP